MSFLDNIGLGSLFGGSSNSNYLNSIDGTTSFNKAGGTFSPDNKAMLNGKVVGKLDNDSGIINALDETTTGSDTGLDLGGLASIAGTGLNIYSNLFGDGKAMNDKKMEALGSGIKLQNQQIKSNKQAMADRKQFNSTWANASNGLGKLNA